VKKVRLRADITGTGTARPDGSAALCLPRQPDGTMNEEILNKYLTGGNDWELLSAVRVLEKNGNLSHLKRLLDATKLTSDPYIIRLAGQAAATIIRRNLVAHFDTLDETTRTGLVKLLAKIDPYVINSVAGDLESRDNSVRLNTVRMLGLMGANPAIATLLKTMVRDRHEKVRATAVSVIKSMPDAIETPVLATLLRDEDPRVVANTVELIGSMGQPKLIPLLLHFEDHENNRIRGNAIKALWGLGEPTARDAVRRMLADPRPAMRASACWVIGEAATPDDPDILDLLRQAADDPDELVRANVVKAQVKIGGGDQFVDAG
jgi:HEAT repeat protein